MEQNGPSFMHLPGTNINTKSDICCLSGACNGHVSDALCFRSLSCLERSAQAILCGGALGASDLAGPEGMCATPVHPDCLQPPASHVNALQHHSFGHSVIYPQLLWMGYP